MAMPEDDAEAVELLTRTAAVIAGETRSAAREKPAAMLLEQLKALDGKAGFRVSSDNRSRGGLIVELRGGNNAKRVWVGYDEWGTISLALLGVRGQATGEMTDVHGLRMDATATRLEGADDDSFYTPEPGKPRRKRSALAVLVDAITTAMRQ